MHLVRNSGYRIRKCYNTMIGCRILTVLFHILVLKYFVFDFILALLSPVLHAK